MILREEYDQKQLAKHSAVENEHREMDHHHECLAMAAKSREKEPIFFVEE